VIGRKNPAEFLPLAEYLGLMPMLEQIVLQMACKKCKNWHNMGHPDYEITVNLSPSQLMYKHMPDYIRRALQESGLEPSNLVLDVTGYDNPRELRHIRQVIREISSLGVKIALDDFGTEFTSFRSMEMIAPDMIKLDRSCISKLGQDAFTDAYVRSAIELADLLKIQTLAKGVEEKEQLDELSGMQLTMAQGYVFDRPMPEEEFEAKYVYGDIG
jgi:EAL domain-containing protein (putative c-di-GMP-specific phosphodiesterase class I)